MANDNQTVFLKGSLGRRREEYKANGAIRPGDLLELTSSNEVRKHSNRGGGGSRLFAMEDTLQGRTVNDNYADDEIVFCAEAAVGERMYARLKAGQNVAVGDFVISNGDGGMVKAAAEFLSNAAVASAAVTNTTTETVFDNGTATIAANSLAVGDVIRVRAQGIATSTNSTDTLTVKLYLGSTQIATTGAVDVANNDIFLIDASIVIRTIGASGTFTATGTVSLGASGTVTAKAFYVASTTIDTTVANTVTVKATWSVASASNSVRQDIFLVEKVDAAPNATTGTAAGAAIMGRVQEANDLSLASDDDWVKIEVL